MKFFKQYWFGVVCTSILAFCLFLCAVVMLAPHQDKQNRGFVKCTTYMAAELSDCRGESLCLLNGVLKNTFCDIDVIAQGIKNWLLGIQKTPWSNYIFVPELDIKREVSPEIDEFYSQNPHLNQEMQKLKEQHEQLITPQAPQPEQSFVPEKLPEIRKEVKSNDKE